MVNATSLDWKYSYHTIENFQFSRNLRINQAS